MPEPRTPGDLEIEQDLDFQRRGWKAQRVAWGAMALLVVAALAGLLGSGPLSHTVAGQKGSRLWVEYQRFGRWQSPEELRIHLGPGQARAGRLFVRVGQSLLDRIHIVDVTPEPESVQPHTDHLTYVFRAPSADVATTILLHVEPDHWGRVTGWIGVPDGPTVELSELVYP